MGMWDWLEQQYPAPGTRAGRNDFPPLSASDGALLRLIEQGVAAGARDEDDEPTAAQAVRETGAAAIARAVKPPYGRDEGWLTQMPEDWLQSISPSLKRGNPAWPANRVLPMSAPVSSALFDGAAATDEPSASQAAREAGAATLARAARHPYGRVFRFAAAGAPAETTNAQQSEDARQAAASRLANAVRRPIGPLPTPPLTVAPVKVGEMEQGQAAYEAGARRIRNAVKPERGHRNEGEITQWIVDHWPEALLFAASAPTGGAPLAVEAVGRTLFDLLRSTRPAE